MHLALYRAYRPETFGEILGQGHIVKILKNQISTDTVSHAYLFCGTRGTGKTTTARILAKGVNCLSEGGAENGRPCGVCENCMSIKDGIFIDVVEIDAASNNGVDNIRELRESVKYPPAVGRKKVYIIDEVHMLSIGAFNALLKTLEEPPEYVIFILATTEPQKLPATILSRCMRLDFRRVPEELIKDGMKKICSEREIEIDEPALNLIAINADGSVRDGFSILDQCIAPGISKVTRDDVLSLLGASGEEVFLELAGRIKDGDTDKALLLIDRALSGGKDARQFLSGMLAHYRNLLIVKFIKRPEDILNISCENAERIKGQSSDISLSDINRAIVEISKTASEAKWSSHPRILLELCAVMLSEGEAPATEFKPQPKLKPEPVQKPKPEPDKKAQPAGTKKDSSGLWNSLFEGRDRLAGSLSMIQSGAEIKSISDDVCTIAAKSEFNKEFIEKNKETIESLIEIKTGRPLIVKCVIEEVNHGSREKTAEEYAAEVGNTLGINIEIEE